MGEAKMEQLKPVKRQSIEKLVREHLEAGKTITTLEAYDLFSSHRLSAVIKLLKQKGMRIRSRFIKTDGGKWVSQYEMERENG